MIIGMTGMSGAGKSTVAALFASRGFRIIDCDVLVHGLYCEKKCAERIAEAFGRDYLLPNGSVDRKKLGSLVFTNKRALTRLNDTVSPLIMDAVVGEINRARHDGVNAVLDAPLLFEYELEQMCDTTLGVICETEIAVMRLSARDGRPGEELRARLASQHDGNYFRSHCAYILENNGDGESLRAAFKKLFPLLPESIHA